MHSDCHDFKPTRTSADIVVLAGDIGNAEDVCQKARKWFPDREIIMVAGNHEFHGHDHRKAIDLMRESALIENIHFLENDEIEINGIRFLGATLWTDLSLDGDPYATTSKTKSQITDYRKILNGGRFLEPEDTIVFHRETVEWLTRKLSESADGEIPTIVVTHYSPSPRSIHEKYRDSLLNPYFASNLEHLFNNVDTWIHGHMHSSFDYRVNDTKIICNPRGHVIGNKKQNCEFNPAFVLEIWT